LSAKITSIQSALEKDANIVMDEAHEGSLDTEFLLTMATQFLSRTKTFLPQTRVMSVTIAPRPFYEYLPLRIARFISFYRKRRLPPSVNDTSVKTSTSHIDSKVLRNSSLHCTCRIRCVPTSPMASWFLSGAGVNDDECSGWTGKDRANNSMDNGILLIQHQQ
jgi:hypothetical protein